MSEKREGGKGGERPDEAGGKGAEGVKRLHYVYHVVAETNQLIKIEELDEETMEAREIPLPLAVDFGGSEEESARDREGDEEAEEYYAGLHDAYGHPGYGPYGYGGYPVCAPWMMGMWLMAPPPYMPYPAPYPHPARKPPRRPPSPWAKRRFEDAPFMGPRKAGSSKFADEALDEGVGRTLKGPLRFVAPMGPRKAGSPKFVGSPEGGRSGKEGRASDGPDEGAGGGPEFSPTGVRRRD